MKNLIGKVVGRLTVIDTADKIGNRCAWLCKCSCGKTVKILQQSLVKNNPTSSCGCLKGEANTKNLLGLKFGLWTVKSISSRKKKGRGGVYWLCVCECGTEKDVSSESLLSNKSISCGCSKDRPVCPKGHIIAEWGRDNTGMCKACTKNRRFMQIYGITLDEYISLWNYQEGRCAICKDKISIQLGRPGYSGGCRAELDHEHDNSLPKKKQVRGILCGGRWAGCNRLLGRIDDIDWLSAAVRYISNPPAREFFMQKLEEKERK